MLDKLKAGTSFAEVAAGAGLKVETRTEIKRGNAVPPLSVRTIDAIFRTAKDGYGTAEAAAAAEQVVFRVTDITMPDIDAASEEAKQGSRDPHPQLHRGRLRRISRLPAASGRRDDQRECAEAGRHRTSRTTQLSLVHADRAAGTGLRQALCARRGAGGVDHAGRRSRDAGVGLPEDRRRPADELPAGIGRRRRRARPLFDHRARARHRLAHRRRPRRDRSERARASATTSRPARSRRWRRCARWSPRAGSSCPMRCRRWPPASSAISATTWCG